MRVLSIGNSFSQDAQRWLHPMATAVGEDLTCVNLYIGGCSLNRHRENLLSGEAAYHYEENGRFEGRMISLQETLQEARWDVVTLQQASHDSGMYSTYQPGLTDVGDFVRRTQPQARLLLHQTWAYEHGSTHTGFLHYGCDQQTMFAALRAAYAQAARTLDVAVLPCGEAIQALRALPAFHTPTGGQSLCRDGYHMHKLYGRFALGAVWLRSLCGADVTRCAFVPVEPDEPAADPALLRLILKTVQQCVPPLL